MTDLYPTSSDGVAAARVEILNRIAKAAKRAGRSANDVDLVAVSKVQPDDRVDAMLAAGQRIFGENRVQEAHTRWSERRTAYSDLELRLIGPLQTNKADDACALFDVIETLDREKLAGALVKAMEKTGRRPALYVQVNTGDEPQKAGLAVNECVEFVRHCRRDLDLPIKGLMCIPPVEEPAAPHFALLAKLAARADVEKLSMGMSSDFELGVQLGATSVRVGSALFGERASN